MSQVTENKVVAAPVPMSPMQEFWHYFKRNKGAVVGLVYVVIMIVIALFAKRFVFMVSQSASRIIFAVPFSKSNEISPHSPSQSAWYS